MSKKLYLKDISIWIYDLILDFKKLIIKNNN